jgi:uncharacterized protein (DUF983 family)
MMMVPITVHMEATLPPLLVVCQLVLRVASATVVAPQVQRQENQEHDKNASSDEYFHKDS